MILRLPELNLKKYFPNLKYDIVNSDIKYEACQADMKLFENIVLWKPEITLEEGIKRCIEIKKLNN